MKRRTLRICIAGALSANVLIIIYFGIIQHRDFQEADTMSDSEASVMPELTIIIRDFEEFENDLANTVANALKLSDKIDILVLCDKSPYPPIKHKLSDRIKFIVLEPSIHNSILTTRPENYIKSKYVLFLPDGVAVSSWSNVKLVLDLFRTMSKQYSAIALPIFSADLACENINFDIKRWTVTYSDVTSQLHCNFVFGVHVLLTTKETILKFTDPFLRPLLPSFYIQNSIHNFLVYIYDKTIFSQQKRLFSEAHNQWKHKKSEDHRRHQMLKVLGVKMIQHVNGHKEWFGCSKQSTRCFDTVVNDMPEYLYLDRWTPPCCLKALKETVHHVFATLNNCGARFWLEGGSLLGAARNGNIIPWDYDVDVGIYKDDLNKCENFQISSKQSIVDESGFVWEKAVEGEFYRVQYSETNRLHVDIFPFYSRNGTMTKNTWMKTHKQDREFPEHYLKPLTTIKFVGIDSPAPNNVRKFLEFKFGKGVIETPKYPNLDNPYS